MSAFPIDPDVVSHGIQLAVAPVFLLTAVSGLIGAVANRLARIIDRARLLEDRYFQTQDEKKIADIQAELQELRKRGFLANSSIALLTLCAFLIGITIMVLFLSETIALPVLKVSMITFLAGVGCFLLALGCFMAETLIAARLLKFKATLR